MQSYKADLHIHTLLSPCGDLSMSPLNIVSKAVAEGLQLIGIADHNSTRQAPLVKKLAEKEGVLVLMGCELTSKEEAHCLAFFENEIDRFAFQELLDQSLPDIRNDEDKFGYQIVVDEEEEIIYEETKLLWSALPFTLDELYDLVHLHNGLFIPAHVDKPSTSLMSQLGFVPPDIKADAIELSKFMSPEVFVKRFAYLKKFSFLKSSDAHVEHCIGENFSWFLMDNLSFGEVRKALRGEEGRKVYCGDIPNK